MNLKNNIYIINFEMKILYKFKKYEKLNLRKLYKKIKNKLKYLNKK